MERLDSFVMLALDSAHSVLLCWKIEKKQKVVVFEQCAQVVPSRFETLKFILVQECRYMSIVH